MKLSGRAVFAGVIGDPVGHSLSPRLHGHWLVRYGVDGVYLPFQVRPSLLESALRGLVSLGARGCNITVPYKERVFELVDSVDPLTRCVGAVNTVIIAADGTLEGRNTDGFGFLESMSAGVSAWSAHRGPAVVLGAGGAARAIVAALLQAGCPEIRLVNRTLARAENMADQFGGPLSVIPWLQRASALHDISLLVNATILGMESQAPLDLSLDVLPRDALVTDIVYVPLETRLLAEARARGNPTVDGLGMLLHQARPGFEAWFGVRPTVDDALRQAVLQG